MDETDDVELSLAELSSLLGAGTAPQGIAVPVSMAVRVPSSASFGAGELEFKTA